jgi:glycosyltransferase involved in cell wall biosynthesis
MKISACIITLNEERNLPRCLRSVAPIADEIVVVDSGSRDGTAEIARKFGARLVAQDWLGNTEQKNFAAEQATHSWVLNIDADEELCPELIAALARLKADPAADSPGAPEGYRVSRMVFYLGKWIRHGDWYPDRLVRLYRRDQARFTGGRVHGQVELPGPAPLLPGHLHHFTYVDAADRTARCAKYAEIWARTAHAEGRRCGALAAPLHAAARFAKGFILKRGFCDGGVGWEIAVGNAREVWMKYRLLRELNRGAQGT